jgi:hypothetical protein
MKNLNHIITLLFLAIYSLNAQTPQKMTYQAVIRDATGQLLKDRNIGMQISVLRGSESGTPVFVERFFPSTNSNGLVTVEIGGGLPVNGSFSGIDWKTGPYFVKTETDINGGSNYTLSATSQLLSIPYALMAANVENIPTISINQLSDVNTQSAQVNQVLKWNGNEWIAANDNTDGGSGPTYTPGSGISIDGNNVITNTGDLSAINEIQQLSLSGTVLTLSQNGGSVTLPTSGGGDNWGTQSVVTNSRLTGNGTQNNPLDIADGGVTSAKFSETGANHNDAFIFDANTNNWVLRKPVNIQEGNGIQVVSTSTGPLNYVINALDASPINEIQTLSLSGQNLSLSNGGGTVTLSNSGDNWGNQTVATNSSLTGNGTNNNALSISQNGVNSSHILNNTIRPEDLSETGVPLYSVLKFVGDATTGGNWQYAPGMTIIAGQGIQVNPVVPSADGAIRISSSSSWNSVGGTVSTADKVGIGISPASANLHILGNDNADIICEHNSVRSRIYVGPLANQTASEVVYGSTTNHNVNLMTDNTIRMKILNSGNIGIGTSTPTSKLDISGTLRVRTISTTSSTQDLRTDNDGNILKSSSDLRLKKNIRNIEGALTKVKKTRPVLFDWKDNPLAVNQFGFIAQEINEIIPEIVNHDNETDLYSVDYTELIPVLTKAIQEQQVMIDELKKEVQILKKSINK